MSNLHTRFDLYQRFRAAAEMIEQAAEELGRTDGLHLVEIGAPDVGLAPFLPNHRITPLARRVQTGGQLPLPDKSVDLAAALDVLEHIAPTDRAAFVADLARIAVHGVVLSFPAAQAEETERFVARMTGRITFADHQRFGLPEPADIEAMIDQAGMTFERRPQRLSGFLAGHDPALCRDAIKKGEKGSGRLFQRAVL